MSSLPPFSIQTPRFLLRRFFLGEVDDYVAYRNDPAVLQYQPWLQPLIPADAWIFFTRQAVAKPGTRNTQTHIAIIDQQTSELVGDIFLKVDAAGVSGEIGVTLGRAWMGRGIEQEVITALSYWASTAQGGPRLQRLAAIVDLTNTNALTAFSAVGYARVSDGMWNGQRPYYVLGLQTRQ